MANINSRKLLASDTDLDDTDDLVLLVVPGKTGTDKAYSMITNEFRTRILAADAITTAAIQDGQVTADKLAANAVTEIKLAASNDPTDGQVLSYANATTGLTWTDGGDVGALSGVVSDATLAGDGTSATPLTIADGGVDTLQLADSGVTSIKMEDGSVGTLQLAASGVTLPKMAPNSVDGPQLVSNSVTTSKILDVSVTADKLATNAVTDIKVLDVSASKITGTLATARIPNLDANKITTGTFDTDRIPNLSANKITSGVFGTARIPDLNANKITSGTLGTARIPNLSANKITSDTLNTGRIPGLAASKITSGTFSTNRIPNLAASKITSGTFPSNVRAITALRGSTGGTLSGFDDSTRLATTEWVIDAMEEKVSRVIGGAPAALNTLNELAAAIGDDEDYAATVTNNLALKANIASPTFTGNPKSVTPSTDDDDISIATTAYVKDQNLVPSGGNTGQALTKTSSGYAWRTLINSNGSSLTASISLPTGSSGAWVTVVSTTITPSSSSNNIRLDYAITTSTTTSGVRILRGNTALSGVSVNTDGDMRFFIDSPSSTSQQTYTLQAKNTSFVNRTVHTASIFVEETIS